MRMGEVSARGCQLSDEDLQFMDQERSLKDLSPSTSTGENSRSFTSVDDTFTGFSEPAAKKSRHEESPSPSSFDFDLFEGLDLPESVVQASRQEQEEEESGGVRKEEAEDCHDFYGKIDHLDEVIAKMEAQLADEDNEQEKAIQEIAAAAAKLVEEGRLEAAREKLMKKQDKQKRRVLAQANKEKQIFCCFVCNKGFLTEELIQEHVNNTHLRNDKRYPHKCTKCHMRYAHRQNLYRHLSTHTGTAYKCPSCPYEFRTEASLDIHSRREHQQKGAEPTAKEQCELCRAEFVSETELKRHSYYCRNREEIALRRKQAKEREKERLVRVGEQVISPAMSNCSASSWSTGTSTGSAGRPTKDKSCPYCLDVFASMQSRNRHIGRKHPEKVNDAETTAVTYFKVDSPDLPYACTTCGKRFASSASCQTHKKRIHEQKLDHVCERCGKAYPLGSELRKHLRRVHDVTEVDAQDMTSF